MELWIRSQDKETIMKVNRIDIDTNGINIMANGFETNIGRYSKERALEVLDEIQTSILVSGANYEEIKNLKIAIKSEFFINIKTGVMIYEMPQE